jgi:hypothetical protein
MHREWLRELEQENRRFVIGITNFFMDEPVEEAWLEEVADGRERAGLAHVEGIRIGFSPGICQEASGKSDAGMVEAV